MLGASLAALRREGLVPEANIRPDYYAIKEAVLPWSRFPGEDTILGPEMRATGEVMGIATDVGAAYGKALAGAGHRVPDDGTVFISLNDRDKVAGLDAARIFGDLGFRILATQGTAAHLARHGISATHVDKVGEGPYDPVRLIEDGMINLVVNTPRGQKARGDGGLIRRAATRHRVACVTTVQGALAVARSLESGRQTLTAVATLQEYHEALNG
jgi:carbamoyl-phosphate synthase large subunit